MASKIPQLQSKVTQIAGNRGGSYYKVLLEQNKHYIQDPPTIEKCQSLAKQLFYTRLARFLKINDLSNISVVNDALRTVPIKLSFSP
ncbi:putative ATP synthase, F0 complex, subunit G [Lupinus albus]|uniref:Putative ATP synthase, F0 complex, subunit G n=1 Tax=Lupinus albus TaxID=3870 RepID=A0A6A4N2Z8_LUPAL|nr:putative ATP synthase, F0 complex, subunit G [Lupinus albus]